MALPSPITATTRRVGLGDLHADRGGDAPADAAADIAEEAVAVAEREVGRKGCRRWSGPRRRRWRPWAALSVIRIISHSAGSGFSRRLRRAWPSRARAARVQFVGAISASDALALARPAPHRPASSSSGTSAFSVSLTSARKRDLGREVLAHLPVAQADHRHLRASRAAARPRSTPTSAGRRSRRRTSGRSRESTRRTYFWSRLSAPR